MVLETKRLLLREMIPDDFQALLRVLGDPETMCHYSYTFDGQHVRARTVRSTGAIAASASETEGSSMPGIWCESTITGKSKP